MATTCKEWRIVPMQTEGQLVLATILIELKERAELEEMED